MYTPQSLYKICTKASVEISVKGFKLCDRDFRSLPNNILFDCFYELYSDGHLCLLGKELADARIFSRLLSVCSKRTELLQMYQGLLDHGAQCISISDSLVSNYGKLVDSSSDQMETTNFIDIGLKLSGFFNDGGWYNCCMLTTRITEKLCHKFERTELILMKLLECYHKKLYSEVAYKELEYANYTYIRIQQVIKELKVMGALPNMAAIYSNFSSFFYMQSDYNEAVEWAKLALKSLHKDLSIRVVIDVLRQASKSCVVKRWFRPAGILIQHALKLATELYAKKQHPHYADTLSDYGFYLLNSDSTDESVKVYKQALSIRTAIFNKYNINVALAHEDLAYVLYVHEYSSGSFALASEHADLALKILNKMLHADHLLMASAKRVKALILEEVALDIPHFENTLVQDGYLKESEELHKQALASSFKAFGEKNVLTAKQYGNLGRLYQSMKKMAEAEKMHLKAIAIKEELLGEKDYEVALSVGHLASLYNYQLCRYTDAEKLYLRSIEININLFGEAYSGLEYDYRGITHVYVKLSNTEKVLIYEQKMREWRRLRKQVRTEELSDDLIPVDQIYDKLFEIC